MNENEILEGNKLIADLNSMKARKLKKDKLQSVIDKTKKLDAIRQKIHQIDADIEDLEQTKRVLKSYKHQLENPMLKWHDWSEEGENILNPK